MRIFSVFLFFITGVVAFASDQVPDWENTDVLGINKEAPRASFLP